MERFVKGDIVAVNFHFSNLSETKRRPALVLLSLTGEDIILVEITKKIRNYQGDITIKEEDFEEGKLKFKSIIRLTRLFTLHKSLISYKIGNLKSEKIKEVIDVFCSLFKEQHINTNL
jgi:mRNA interferase MazF